MFTLYLNPEKSPVTLQAKASGSPITALKFKRGANVPLRVVLLGTSSAQHLRMGIKAKNAFEADLLVYGEATTGIAVEEGMAFELMLNITSLALNEVLDVGGGADTAPAALAAMTEFSWQENGSLRLSDTIATTIYNDIIRLAQEAPDAAPGEYPAADLLATKSWVNNLRASAAAAGLVLLESDAIIESEYSAVALTSAGTIAIPQATVDARGSVKLGTASVITGKNVRPVGENASGGMAVDVSGMSAYEIALANGFVGTEAAWLASLVGAKGAKGEQGESADVEETAQATLELLASPIETIVQHATCEGSDNANFYWAQIDSAHLRAGVVSAIELPCRLTENAEVSTSPLYLIIWQRMQPTDTELARIGVSTNAVTPSIGGSARWEFDRLELNGEDIRICFSTDQNADWDGTHTFGGRALSCSDGAAEGCRINASNGASNYLVEMHMDFIVESLRFAPASHVSDQSLHLSEAERQNWNAVAPSTRSECRYALFWDLDLSGSPTKLSDLLTENELSALKSMPMYLSGSFALPLGEYALLVCKGADYWEGNDLLLASGGCLSKFSYVRYFNFPFGQ